MLKGPEVFGN